MALKAFAGEPTRDIARAAFVIRLVELFYGFPDDLPYRDLVVCPFHGRREECGILVPPGDESRLTEALNTMLDHCHEYDRGTIRQYGAQYSFAEVGAQFKHVYEQIPTL